MDENIKYVNQIDKTFEDETLTEKEAIKFFQELVNEKNASDWFKGGCDCPSLEEFNSPDYGKIPVTDAEPEIMTLNQELTQEIKDKILQEFQYAADVANVKPIAGHPHFVSIFGEDTTCPILNNPDEIMVKINEVFHPEQVGGCTDKHFILSNIRSKMPNRNIDWRDGCLCVDGARTNITYQSVAAIITRKLQKVFGPSKI